MTCVAPGQGVFGRALRHGQDFVVNAVTYPPISRVKSFVKFSDFKEIYTGGVTIPDPNGRYLRANPKTFNGQVSS